MTDATAEPTQTSSPATADQVRQFLKEHPDFLIDNPDLLSGLTMSDAQEGDGVINMQRFVVDRLRDRLSEIENQRGEIIENARSNQTSLAQVHAAVLALLAAADAEALLHTIEQDLPIILDIDRVALGFETTLEDAMKGGEGPVHFLRDGSIDAILGYGRTILLREETPLHTALYGETEVPIQSDALVRLRRIANHDHCLLAFGSTHENTFHPGQGTELLSFLARVVEYCLDRWLSEEVGEQG